MKNSISIINELKSLDLSTYPYEQILEIIQSIGNIGSIKIDLPVGKSIIRSRPNEPEIVFSSRKELSYKPATANTTYQRASTPYQTMFYGCPIPDSNQEGAEGSARVCTTFETSYLMRDNQDGEQKMTFSRWRVKKPISVFIFCHNKDFYTKNPWVNILFQEYLKNAQKMRDDEFQSSLMLNSFFADEFAKRVADKHDYNYMISAIFSEITIKTQKGEMGGIYYPSVRADGMAYNIAIKPERVKDSLELVAAGECTLYKIGQKCFLDAETACIITDDSQPFKLMPIQDNYHFGREKSIAHLQKMS